MYLAASSALSGHSDAWSTLLETIVNEEKEHQARQTIVAVENSFVHLMTDPNVAYKLSEEVRTIETTTTCHRFSSSINSRSEIN